MTLDTLLGLQSAQSVSAAAAARPAAAGLNPPADTRPLEPSQASSARTEQGRAESRRRSAQPERIPSEIPTEQQRARALAAGRDRGSFLDVTV